MELLTLATLGTVLPVGQAAEVTRSGADYLLRIPLSGFSAPADAAATAVVRPAGGGVWDLAAMTFPPAGTFQSATGGTVYNRVTFSIGKQSVHGQIDPSLAQPSSVAADLGALRLWSDQGDHHSEQTFDRYSANATMSADASGLLSIASRGQASNWHMTAEMLNGTQTDAQVRNLSGHFAVEGLNRAQGTRLQEAVRGLAAEMQAHAAGQPNVQAGLRVQLQALADAVPGLLTRFETDETLDGVRFAVGPTSSGTVGRLRIDMASEALDERLDARMGIAMDDFAIATVPVETAVYVPHHIDLKSVLAGVRTGPLLALIRAATQDADLAGLQAQFTALFSDPKTRLGIETLSFDSGPMRVTGSARFVPRPSGEFGADIHLSATGVDTFIAQAQGNPALQQVLPIMFMAKGMGRPEGNAIVWDIVFGNGPMTVNGVTLGQPAGRKR